MDDWGQDDKGKGKDKEKEKEKGKGKEKEKGKGKEKDAKPEDDMPPLEDAPRLVPASKKDGRSYVPGPGATLATDADDQLYIVDPANQTIMKVVDTKGKDARAAYEDRRAQQGELIKQLMRAAVKEAKHGLGEAGLVDGEATATRGPCDCGFRHMCEGREVDFVYPIETSKGAKIIGYSLTDNVYDVAEKFVMKYDLAKNTLNHNVYVQQIANSLLEATSDKWRPNIDKKPEKESTWDPTKAQVFRGNGMAHYNKEKGIFEGTMYPPLEDTESTKAERKKKEDTVKANQDRLVEERKRKEEESKSIQAQIRRDQDEKEAERKYRSQLQQIHETNPAAAFVKKKRVVDENGNVKYVDDNEPDLPFLVPTKASRSPKSKKQKSEGGPATLNSLRSGPMDDSSDEDSDDSEDSEPEDPMANGRLPEMEDWNTEMVYNSMRIRGEQKTKQALRDSGFDDHEVGKILSISMAYAMNRARARKQYQEDKKDRKARKALMAMQRAMMLGMGSSMGMDREREREKEKEKPAPSFSGHGNRLVDTPKFKPLETPEPSADGTPVAAASPSTYKIDFNHAAPKASIRVRGPSGVLTVELNLTHTVRQLYDHLRTISNLMSNAVIKLHLPPAQVVEESDLTIQEAKLVGVVVILKL